MKILINCVGLKPLFYDKGGAIEKIVSEVLLTTSKNYDVTIFGALEKNRVKVSLIPQQKIPSVCSIFSYIYHGIVGFLKMRDIKTDIIISTHQRNVMASFLYSKIKKKPMVAWELDHEFWVLPHSFVKRVHHFLIKHVDKTLSISSIQKKRMIESGVSSKKIITLYNCINTNDYRPSKTKKLSENYILYVAKFTERKNHIALLLAYKKVVEVFPTVMLYIVGPKTGGFSTAKNISRSYTQFIAAVRTYQLEKNVKIFENIQEPELISLYQNANLFVFPSLIEGFGMTLLEAMSCGCPCIIYNIEPQSEVLGNAGYIVLSHSIESLSYGIIEVLKNKELQQSMSKYARERAVALFDSKKISKRFDRILNKYGG